MHTSILQYQIELHNSNLRAVSHTLCKRRQLGNFNNVSYKRLNIIFCHSVY